MILESVGGASLSAAYRRIAANGTLVTFGDSSGEPVDYRAADFYGRAAGATRLRLHGLRRAGAPAHRQPRPAHARRPGGGRRARSPDRPRGGLARTRPGAAGAAGPQGGGQGRAARCEATDVAAEVRITEYTDPGCPWAWSAEPFRRRLQWLYGDSIDWRERMVGLSESPEDYEEKGFTPEKQAARRSPRSPRTTACRSTPRSGRGWRPRCPPAERWWPPSSTRPSGRAQLLRCLRVQNFSGALLDERETIESAAARGGARSRRAGGLDGRGADTEAVLRERDGRRPRAHPGRARARREAGRLVRRAALHLPVV